MNVQSQSDILVVNELKIQIINKINVIKPLIIDDIHAIDEYLNDKNNRGIYTIVITDDEKYFMVKKEILNISGLLKELLDNDEVDINMVPINTNSKVVPYLICYMDYHYNKLTNEIEKPIVDKFMDISSISNWDKQFVCTIIDENEKINDLFINCLNASNFLSIIPLCNLLCARFACSIGLSDMTTETLRIILNENNDLTPEEEKKISDELKFIENSYSDNLNKYFVNPKNKKIINDDDNIDDDEETTTYEDLTNNDDESNDDESNDDESNDDESNDDESNDNKSDDNSKLNNNIIDDDSTDESEK